MDNASASLEMNINRGQADHTQRNCIQKYLVFPAMGIPGQRVPAQKADRKRGVLQRGDQDRSGKRVWHGLPGPG